MLYDYRELQGKAEYRQKQVLELSAKEELTDADRDKIAGLMGEIRALEEAAGELRDAEIKELREIVARGTVAPGAEDPKAQEVKDFLNFLKTGQRSPGIIQDASMSTTDANGGYLVPEPKHAELIEVVRKNNPIFGNATVFDMTGGDTTMQLPIKSAHGVATTAAEAGARSEQNAPELVSPSLVCYDYYSDQRATQHVIDCVAGMEEKLLQWIYEDIFEQADYDAVIANGATKIKGIFAHTGGTATDYGLDLSGAANALNNTCWLTTYFKLPIKFRRNAIWLMAPATLGVAAAYADPASANIKLATQQGDDWVIYGKKVVECDSAPAIGDGAYPVAFGDVAQGYAVGIHRNVGVLRDPFTATPKIRFYGLGRLGGAAWNYQAIRLIKSDDA